jgi:ferredoxin
MVLYTIKVDRGVCIGDKLCCQIAEDTFDFDDEGKVRVVNPQGDPPDDILEAAQNCRMEAITLHDAASGEKVWPRD